jgi:hypothetical protein
MTGQRLIAVGSPTALKGLRSMLVDALDRAAVASKAGLPSAGVYQAEVIRLHASYCKALQVLGSGEVR